MAERYRRGVAMQGYAANSPGAETCAASLAWKFFPEHIRNVPLIFILLVMFLVIFQDVLRRMTARRKAVED
ncbi:hypothetical protein CRUP_028022 [Coryphaenoides rupestris]|nr:hypothetical protein CRUP_028022 [Coryphaenoides rupestris]